MIVGLYGSGGCGRSLMPLAREQFGADKCFWIDDHPASETINGTPILTFSQFLIQDDPDKRACITVANSKVRAKLVEKCAAEGIAFVTLQAANTVVMDDVEVGEGAALSPFVTLTSNIRIGRHFHANLYSYVEHDCVIGDYVTFAPGVRCNGYIHIGDHAYIGSGAIIRNGRPDAPLTIGDGAVIGMGAVVTRSVPAGEIWIGNPAAPIARD